MQCELNGAQNCVIFNSNLYKYRERTNSTERSREKEKREEKRTEKTARKGRKLKEEGEGRREGER